MKNAQTITGKKETIVIYSTVIFLALLAISFVACNPSLLAR